jgi:ABC-2 type transport system ATP-binding protein
VSASAEIVRVDDLVKDVRPGFGLRKKRILDGISFRVREREIFGFIGPNGAGKTTTLKVLMGLIRPTSGQASILGHDVSEVAFRRQIGFLPEQPYFYDYLTGCELLRFYAKLSGVSPRRREGRVMELLELVGLSEAGKTRLRNYSKGMLQRIGIAQALVHDPQVVFLDEPMSGLDPVGRKEVRDIILRLRTEGKTVFMNTHILSDVEMVCDRVAIIANGRIRYEGAIDEYLDAGEPEADLVFANLSAEAAVRLEERFGARLRGHGERIELRIAEKDASEVLRVALDASAEVISVTPHRVSLESIFLSTVNEADAEEDSR